MDALPLDSRELTPAPTYFADRLGEADDKPQMICNECGWKTGPHPAEEDDAQGQMFAHRAEAGHWDNPPAAVTAD